MEPQAAPAAAPAAAAPAAAPAALAPASPRPDASALAVSRAARAAEPLLHMRPRTTRDDPDFVSTFFAASRLHFIGSWRERFERLVRARPPAPPLRAPPAGRAPLVLHVDMDCFFASVAALGRPELGAGAPLAVCWGGRGGDAAEISSANYAARRDGVRAGMWLRRENVPSLDAERSLS